MLRVVVVGVCSYTALVVLLRAFGKRTLSQFNAFDFVVTVALGSTLATTLLSKETALSDGVVAFALLMTLQFIATWLSMRIQLFDRLIRSDPRLLYYQGRYLQEALLKERVMEQDVLSAVREQGIASMEEVEAVVLETSGMISAIRKGHGRPTALAGVCGGELQRTPAKASERPL